MRTLRPSILIQLVMLLSLAISTSLYAAAESEQVPPPEQQDIITQNKGNIQTTISNWGVVGGLGHLGFPSGEWPKGSNHNYLAEIKYWMGATLVSGDTALANSDDDFQPVLSLMTQDYGINLSTDVETYPYDGTDTVGIGIEHPAYGWRVWDPDLEEWVYNQVWDNQTQQFIPAGPTSQQESIYRFDDQALGSPVLGLEMTHKVYQWNYSYNEDYLFVILEITNKSTDDYTDFAFGLYCDFDIGGPDGTGENGRLGDMVAMDTSQNLAWTYDVDGYDRGWGPTVVTGVMGTRYIETPDNIGMTSFRTGQWEKVPSHDPERYAYIAEGVFDDPIPPTDQYYLQCTSGINLEAGKTIRIVYALIAGYDEEDFRNKAQMAQSVYNNHFIGPEPPKVTNLHIRNGDKNARLIWDQAAEESVDPMSGLADFAGYKIYRSSDQGLTWGRLERHPDGSVGPDYVPLAVWRIDDLEEPIPHTFIDSNLTNGFEYWYSVVAFDKGDTIAGIEPLQTAYGRPGEDYNCVSALPRTDPAGYFEIEKTLEHLFTGSGSISEGEVIPILFDENQFTGDEYEIGFAESPYYTTWFVINKSTGDTLLKDQVDQSGDIATMPVVDGVRLMVKNGERYPAHFRQTNIATGFDTTLHLGYTYGAAAAAFGFPLGGDMHFRSTYQVRFTDQGSEGYSFYDDVTPIDLPFEVWNTTFDQQVICEIYHLDYENPGWDPRNRDYLVIVDFPYDGQSHPEAYPYWDVWFFRFDQADTNWSVGDVFEIGGAPVNGAGDRFVYKAPGVDQIAAANELDKIRVVPNPYISRAAWEVDEGQRRLEFTHLPDEATVRVYTLAGDLVQTLHHQGSGTLVWDMLSENSQGIAPGLYFYHVDSPVGTKTGKFAVIK